MELLDLINQFPAITVDSEQLRTQEVQSQTRRCAKPQIPPGTAETATAVYSL
jgi:hypothetical protein